MVGFELSDFDKKVLSYVSRGISKDGAVQKISDYFSARTSDVNDSLKSLKDHGYIIENKGVGISVLTTSPLKVKSAMLDQKIVSDLADREHSAKAGGFKHHKFNVDTGEIEDPSKKREAPKKKGSDLGFDLA